MVMVSVGRHAAKHGGVCCGTAATRTSARRTRATHFASPALPHQRLCCTPPRTATLALHAAVFYLHTLTAPHTAFHCTVIAASISLSHYLLLLLACGSNALLCGGGWTSRWYAGIKTHQRALRQNACARGWIVIKTAICRVA